MTRYWFKPKRYGYGATPVTWEGWAFSLLATALIVGSSFVLLEGPPDATRFVIWALVLVLVVAAMVVVSKHKTEGGWRWRWGGDP
jgi:hypothetical protein